MNWKDRIARFKGWKWLIIGSVVGAVISLIWLLFINNVGEEWLGFIGGILGSIIGILGKVQHSFIKDFIRCFPIQTFFGTCI